MSVVTQGFLIDQRNALEHARRVRFIAAELGLLPGLKVNFAIGLPRQSGMVFAGGIWRLF